MAAAHTDGEDLSASRALLSTLFSTRKDLLQELLSEAELGFAWRRVLPVPQGFDSGHLSIALLKRLNAASQSHVSAAGLEQVVRAYREALVVVQPPMQMVRDGPKHCVVNCCGAMHSLFCRRRGKRH
jgi:hypothetical protein